MPIVSNEAKNFKPATGGSPRGWTFIGTGLDCWRKFAFRYIAGLFPLKTAEPLIMGIIYHALQEGKSEQEAKAIDPDLYTEASKMFKDRMEKGPPLPKNDAVVVEKEFSIFGGLMTSKPDRIEGKGKNKRVRDFKTSMYFSENDELSWAVDGGILGECIAGDTTIALVDIQKKFAPEKKKDGKPYDGKLTKIVTVELTDEKKQTLERMVQSFWFELEDRVKQLALPLNTVVDADRFFPRSLKGCVSKYGLCPYYARCWQKGTAESFMFKHFGPPRNWANYKPKVKWMDELEEATKKLRAL